MDEVLPYEGDPFRFVLDAERYPVKTFCDRKRRPETGENIEYPVAGIGVFFQELLDKEIRSAKVLFLFREFAILRKF